MFMDKKQVITKKFVISKLTYRFTIMPVKVPVEYFTEIEEKS